MTRQHYLPAQVVARFSARPALRARDSVVCAHRIGGSAPYPIKAGKVCWRRDLYDLDGSSWPVDAIDAYWTQVERRLPQALDRLTRVHQQPIDLRTWLRVLVPYVTSLFVRGIDFSARFGARCPPGLEERMSPETSNGARAFELQRLLAPVMCADWTVMRRQSGGPLINNEAGILRTIDDRETIGWAIPIDSSTILALHPKSHRTLGSQAHDGVLTANIRTHVLTREETASFNGMAAAWAGELIFGPTEESVVAAAADLPTAPLDRQALMEWPVDSAVRRAHEFEWHRLTSHVGLNSVRRTPRGFQDIDFDALGATAPWVIFPTNVPELPSGLSMRGSAIMISLNARWGHEEAQALDA